MVSEPFALLAAFIYARFDMPEIKRVIPTRTVFDVAPAFGGLPVAHIEIMGNHLGEPGFILA
jgi:hypothetical protein